MDGDDVGASPAHPVHRLFPPPIHAHARGRGRGRRPAPRHQAAQSLDHCGPTREAPTMPTTLPISPTSNSSSRDGKRRVSQYLRERASTFFPGKDDRSQGELDDRVGGRFDGRRDTQPRCHTAGAWWAFTVAPAAKSSAGVADLRARPLRSSGASQPVIRISDFVQGPGGMRVKVGSSAARDRRF